MFTREKYCAVCGCLFSLPHIRNPVNPDPDENAFFIYNDPYDSRLLPRELIRWLTNFRVVGHCENIDTSFENVSSIPNFFISSPAIWEYGYGIGEPSILTIAGKEKKVTIYEHVDNVKGMFFPIHKTCLDILQRICQIRQAQDQGSDSAKPKTLEAFCDALLQQRKRNFTDPKRSVSAERRYAGAGGIEWPHDYYGARQFWTDEWDTEPGWELLCADPSSLKIPDLSSYLYSELPKSPSTIPLQATFLDHLADRLGWLFPEEAETITGNEIGHIDWEKGIELLFQKADIISADEGGVEEGKKKLASAPLGLKNRWRIWKILQEIRLSD